MKKITALFLALLMLLPSLLACNETTPEETTEAEVPAETTLEETTAPAPTGLSLISEGATEYVIVRPSECQSFIVDAMSELRAAVKDKYGINITPKDDWVKGIKDGEAYDSAALEILIGATNRRESIDVLATLEAGQYAVRVVGNKLVIVGTTDYLTGLAVEEFTKYVTEVAGASELTVDNDYSVLKSQEDFNNLLMGITMYAMGDSYFGGSSVGKAITWVDQMGKKYGMDFINYGIGGSTMSAYVTNKDPMCIR